MTGFGNGDGVCNGTGFDVEIRSLNHRFLDITVRSPKDLASLEMQIRSKISGALKRGKVDITIARRAHSTDAPSQAVQIDRAQFDGYLKLYKELLSEFASGMRPESFERFLGDILTRPGVLLEAQNETRGVSEAEVGVVLSAVDAALSKLISARSIEGKAIESELRKLLEQLNGVVATVSTVAPSLSSEAKKRLEERLKRLFPDVEMDEARIVQEACMLAERYDVAEELQRLQQHLELFEASLCEEAPGKRLDFLVQEINRELNTIASKSQNAPINHMIVEAKVTVEKVREQLQNIE